jgi:quercetin dioxygenase-like cupin family protein
MMKSNGEAWGGNMFKTLVFALAVLFSGIAVAVAQQSGSKRTVLQQADVPGTVYESVFVMVESPGGTQLGRHSHPGSEQGTLIEGDITLMVEGQPDKTYKSGDSWLIPAGVIHDAKVGAMGSKAIVIYIVEKGKPLATPAPK